VVAEGAVNTAGQRRGEDPYPSYFDLLSDLHRRLQPRTYLEIGVHEGDSMSLVGQTTRILGVDPEPRIAEMDHPDWTVVAERSESLFREHDVPALLGGPLDLAFVDGLHLFEVALADVLALERLAHPGSVVLVHDVLPMNAETSGRERTTVFWSGDVWKVVVALRRHRRDLSVTTLDVGPTGMAVITGFGSRSGGDPGGGDDYEPWFEEVVSDLLPADYQDLLAMGLTEALGVVPGTPDSLERCLADRGELSLPGPDRRARPAPRP